MQRQAIFWFRRDLRLHDNAGLYHALRSGSPVTGLFIFDKNILDELKDRADRRLNFIYEAITGLKKELRALGSDLLVKYAIPEQAWKEVIAEMPVADVFTNHDYEPYARKRDLEIQELLREQGIGFHSYKDQVIFEKNEVLSGSQSPYTVFTPYSKAWLAKANEFYLRSYPAKNYFSAFQKRDPLPLPSLETMGFKTEAFSFPGKKPPEELIRAYGELRDFPAQDATSHLGVHLRFGTISIRELAKEAQKLNAVFLKELIWREFFMQVLWHRPRVVDESFRKQYDRIEWINNEAHFQRWCEGKTGYPIVDAGMRELNATGYMHNRVRMITGSFLTKHLLTDWRRGESYFAEKLLDYELAANNGNWQWVAGTGCDSAPYFRIFNPYEQTKKFDPQGKYIRKWVPEFDSLEYAAPIVEHVKARERALMVYKKAVG